MPPRGGARPGAGRPKTGITTTVKRIPNDLLEEVDSMVRHYRAARKLPPDAMFPDVDAPRVELPYFSSSVHAGMPSPADDYVDRKVSLDAALIAHPASTFLLRVEGDSMIGRHIEGGDTLIVDSASEPHTGDIVIAAVEGQFTCKTLFKNGKVCELRPANDKYPPITFPQTDNDYIVGVVTGLTKKFKR